MEPVRFEQFERESDAFDSVVLRTPDSDHFCSASDWILAAREAWNPGAETWIRRGEEGYAAFLHCVDARGVGILHSFDTMWGFACPLAGEQPARLAADFARACQADDSCWRYLVVTGLEPASRMHAALTTHLTDWYPVYECARLRRWHATLAGGIDGYLARRTPRFRQALRAARRRVHRAGIEIETSYAPVPEGMDRLFERMLEIERRSWKGAQATGLLIGVLERFYRPLASRLAARGALRALFARHRDRDVGYILGGVLNRTYRGLQFSFDATCAKLSLGNVIQFHQIRDACGDGIRTYDLGIDMDYKRRWAEEPCDTVSLAVMRA